MSEEQLKAFLAKVKADTSLQEKLKAAGFTISANEIQNIESPLEVLSDGKPEGVAGGNLDNSKGKDFLDGFFNFACGGNSPYRHEGHESISNLSGIPTRLIHCTDKTQFENLHLCMNSFNFYC